MAHPVAKFDDPRRQIEDEARFLKSWIERPLLTGAVSPSGKHLARAMANAVDPARPGPVIELGPGTGPVTEALIRRGIDESRLVLLEYNLDFCRLLHARFPKATVVHGDAYRLKDTLKDHLREPPAAIVSGLPLFTKPERMRLTLLDEAFELAQPGAPFVQFTYAVVSPVPLKAGGFEARATNRIWRNLPPARVWIYRRPGA